MKNALALAFRCMIATAMVVSFIAAIANTLDPGPYTMSAWAAFWGFAIVRYLQLIADTLMGLDRWAMLAKSFSDPYGEDAKKVEAKRAEAATQAARANAEA